MKFAPQAARLLEAAWLRGCVAAWNLSKAAWNLSKAAQQPQSDLGQ